MRRLSETQIIVLVDELIWWKMNIEPAPVQQFYVQWAQQRNITFYFSEYPTRLRSSHIDVCPWHSDDDDDGCFNETIFHLTWTALSCDQIQQVGVASGVRNHLSLVVAWWSPRTAFVQCRRMKNWLNPFRLIKNGEEVKRVALAKEVPNQKWRQFVFGSIAVWC